MVDNQAEGLVRVALDTSSLDQKIPRAAKAMKDLEKNILQSTGAIAAKGKANLDQLGAAATALQAKVASVNTVRAAPGFGGRVSNLSNQLISQAGAPGAINNSLSSKIAALRNNYLVTSGQVPPVQGPRVPSSLGPNFTAAQAQAQLNAQVQTQFKNQAQAQRQLNLSTTALASARLKLANQEKLDQQKLFAIQMRSARAPADTQSLINSILGGAGSSQSRIGAMGAGASRNQAFYNQLVTGGVPANAARYLIGSGGGMPPGWGGRGGAAAGGGAGGQGWGSTLQRFGTGIASGLGIGVGGLGGYAAIQGVRAVVESTQAATAYKRQSIAAKELAGSQEQLNALLRAYEEASGGAIAKTTEMNNVTRLLSTGFAKNAEEIERFVRATRGASIALGKPEDYVIQETQLAISNVSQKRLDQIGLGIKEVVQRVEQLRTSNKNWSRETAFQEAVLSLMEEKYSHLTTTLEGQATGLEKLRKAWADLYLTMGQGAKSPVDSIAGAIGRDINELMENFNQFMKNAENLRKGVGGAIDANNKPGEIGLLDAKIFADPIGDWADRMDAKINRWFASLGSGDPNQFNDPVISPVRKPQPSFRTEDQQDLIDKNYENIEQIEKNFNKARLEETRNYEEQRTKIVADYGRTMAREEEDFMRQRARSLRDYERSIMDLLRDAQERDIEMREDYEKTIAEAREDSAERISEIEEEYNERREEAEKEHRDALMKAAGQLDAIAVLEERKRWRREQEQAEKQHDKALKNEKKNLDKRLEDAREAYEEQLEDARKADAKRLEDMRVNRESQLADEDEDRALRIERAAEDHNLQLEELDRQHGLRMEQIAAQAEEERTALEEAFGFALAEVGIYVAGFQKKMEERDALIEAWFNRVVDRLEKEIAHQQGQDKFYDPLSGSMISTKTGAPVFNTAPVSVSGGKSVVVQPGAIIINAHPAMDEERVANYALTKMAEFLEEYDR